MDPINSDKPTVTSTHPAEMINTGELAHSNIAPLPPNSKKNVIARLDKRKLVILGCTLGLFILLSGLTYAQLAKPENKQQEEQTAAENHGDSTGSASHDEDSTHQPATDTTTNPTGDPTTPASGSTSTSPATSTTHSGASSEGTTTSPQPTNSGGSAPTPNPSPTPTASLSIDIYDGSFSLTNINLKAGTTYTITITNKGSNEAHTLTSALFDTGTLNPGQSKTISYKPTSTGNFKFYCNNPCPPYHNNMQNGYSFTVS